MVKNVPAVRETWVQSLGCEDPLEKGKATHSRILAWTIPWTEEPGIPWTESLFPWDQKELDMTEQLSLLLLLYHLIVCDPETAEIFLLSSNNHSN